MQLNEYAKEVINKHAQLADEDLAEFYVTCYDECFGNSSGSFNSIIKYVVDVAGIPAEEEQEARLHALLQIITRTFQDYHSDPLRDINDASHGYSRLQYLVEQCGNFMLKYRQIEDYFLAHHKEYGLKAIPLHAPYGWEGDDDWDLGDFNKEAFDVLCGNGGF